MIRLSNCATGGPAAGAARRVGRGLAATILAAALSGLVALGQDRAPITPSSPATQPALPDRQETIRDRVQHLEGRLLLLGKILSETEPDKAERLREALDFSGQRQLKRRLEKAVEYLRNGQLSDAEREQQALLTDLQSMLKVLTDTSSDLDRRRAEREKLEAIRRGVNRLREDQLEQIYRTQAAEKQPNEAALREIERLERGLEQRAVELGQQMAPAGDSADKPRAAGPGQRQLENARQKMQSAADRLGEQKPDAAEDEEQAALEQLQRAMDELDDSLRQVRREELQETLTALETRFRSMLAREMKVKADVSDLQTKGPAKWERTDQLRLAETAKVQHEVAEDCRGVVRILTGEGTTVVLPDLAEQMAADMREIAGRLDQADVTPTTQAMLDRVIASLEEIVAAVEARRNQEQEQASQTPDNSGGGDDEMQALLPGSAELKLLRSSQLRINHETAELGDANSSITAAERQQMLERLGERQKRIAELARRMNERQ